VVAKLKSESFEPLIAFLAFQVQKLWQNHLDLDKKYFWEIFSHNFL